MKIHVSLIIIFFVMSISFIGCGGGGGRGNSSAILPIVATTNNTAKVAVKIDQTVVNAVHPDNLEIEGDHPVSSIRSNVDSSIDSVVVKKYALIASYFNAVLKNSNDEQIGSPVSIDPQGACFFKDVPVQNDLRVEINHKLSSNQQTNSFGAKLSLITYIGEISVDSNILKEIVITCSTMAIAQLMKEGRNQYGTSFNLEMASKALDTIEKIADNIQTVLSGVIPTESTLEETLKQKVPFSEYISIIQKLPSISNICENSMSDTSSVISFSISEPLEAEIEYGLTTDYEITKQNPVLKASSKTSHQFTLSSLSSNMTYHYRIVVYSPNGRAVTSDKAFVTSSGIDKTLPTISDIVAKPLSDCEVVIYWNSSKLAYGYVEFGLSSNYGFQTPINNNLQASFSIDVNDLIAGQKIYHYRIISTDASGNKFVTPDYTFTLKDSIDVTGPIVANVNELVSADSAVISFITDEMSLASITYGQQSLPSQTINDPKTIAGKLQFSLSHSITLSDLSRTASYAYQITSVDKSGNTSQTGFFYFRVSDNTGNQTSNQTGTQTNNQTAIQTSTEPPTTTFAQTDTQTTTQTTTQTALQTDTQTDPTPLVISDVTFLQNSSFTTDHIVTIKWETNLDCECTISYGINTDRSLIVPQTAAGNKHSVVLKTTGADSNYGFTILGKQISTGKEVTLEGTFKTPKIEVSQFGITPGIDGNTSNFTFSTSAVSRVRILYGLDSVTENTTAELSASGTLQQILLDRLTPNTLYMYEIRCIDSLGNECISNSGTFKTLKIAIDQANIYFGAGGTSASFTFSTSAPAKVRVRYGLNSVSENTSKLSEAFSTSQQVFIYQLSSNVTYNYEILCTDRLGNEYVCKSDNFNTAVQVISFGKQIDKMHSLMLIRIGLADSTFSPTVTFDTNNGPKTFSKSIPLSKPEQNLIVLAYNNTDLFAVRPFSSMTFSLPIPPGATVEIFDPSNMTSLIKINVHD
ncbi:MAG: hypothetical protein HQM08_16895 [Candidatus Riflebacteria bacterium]|nr:hypothetical protein [Candidatus Riflebacteria bacterium]